MVCSSNFSHLTPSALNEILRKELNTPEFDCEKWQFAGWLLDNKSSGYTTISNGNVSVSMYGDTYQIKRASTPVAICEGFLVWLTANTVPL